MQELNYLTMLTAIRECVNKEKFRVGIFIKKQANVSTYSDLIEKSMDKEEREAKSQTITTNRSGVIWFKNGSFIRILNITENARGYAFHKVLYEPDISHTFLNTIIRDAERYRII